MALTPRQYLSHILRNLGCPPMSHTLRHNRTFYNFTARISIHQAIAHTAEQHKKSILTRTHYSLNSIVISSTRVEIMLHKIWILINMQQIQPISTILTTMFSCQWPFKIVLAVITVLCSALGAAPSQKWRSQRLSEVFCSHVSGFNRGNLQYDTDLIIVHSLILRFFCARDYNIWNHQNRNRT